jgi:hypothetical protein
MYVIPSMSDSWYLNTTQEFLCKQDTYMWPAVLGLTSAFLISQSCLLFVVPFLFPVELLVALLPHLAVFLEGWLFLVQPAIIFWNRLKKLLCF